MTRTLAHKAFAVWFADLEKWSVGSFVELGWKWPRNLIRPLADVLRRKEIEVDRTTVKKDAVKLVTLRFDGSMEPRKGNGSLKIKGRLWWADPGDVVYSKIDVRNGAIGIVPESFGRACVTSEFPTYAVNSEIADARFIKLFFRTVAFRRKINSMISGTSGRKRVQPTDLVNIDVPIPPLAVQQTIVSFWEKAQKEVDDKTRRIAAIENHIEADFLSELGLTRPDRDALLKSLTVWWADLDRWSVMFNQLSNVGADLTSGKYSAVKFQECISETRNGFCIKPVSRTTPHKMLKLSALQTNGLNLAESKYIKISEKTANRFHIRKGDLLICRSIGSYDQIAKCSLVEDDHPDILFPDIIIRVQCNNRIEPAFAREVIQSAVGKAWFQQNARTSVGMWKIGGSDITSFPMPLPPLAVQRTLVERIAKRRKEVATMKINVEQKASQAIIETEAMILGERRMPA